MENQSSILWIEYQKINISGLLDFFDFKEETNQAFTHTHAFGTKDAQKKIQKISGLKLLISNLYVDEYQGQSVVNFINDNQKNGLFHQVPIMIYSTFVGNRTLSTTAEPCLCSGERLKRLDDLQKMNNIYFLSFHNSNNKTFYKAVENLQKQKAVY